MACLFDYDWGMDQFKVLREKLGYSLPTFCTFSEIYDIFEIYGGKNIFKRI
jgi:hypothetical protein